jgi:hypothetical protein
VEPQLLLDTESEDGPVRLMLAAVDGLQAAGEAITQLREGGAGFALLLLLDGSSETTEAIVGLAETCIAEGLFWLSAWGPDCERVHDIFDEVDAERLEGAAVYDVVMTTWHDEEELGDTLSFFWHVASAADHRASGPLRLVMAVGHPAWAEEVAGLVAGGLDDR